MDNSRKFDTKVQYLKYKVLREKNIPIKSVTILPENSENKDRIDKSIDSIAKEIVFDRPIHDTGSNWYAVIGLFLPIVGIILAIIFKKINYIKNYKVCKKFSIISLSIIASIIVIFFIFLLSSIIKW